MLRRVGVHTPSPSSSQPPPVQQPQLDRREARSRSVSHHFFLSPAAAAADLGVGNQPTNSTGGAGGGGTMELMEVCGADRVLIQVTKHGTRVVTELPPWTPSFQQQQQQPNQQQVPQSQPILNHMESIHNRIHQPHLHTTNLIPQQPQHTIYPTSFHQLIQSNTNTPQIQPTPQLIPQAIQSNQIQQPIIQPHPLIHAAPRPQIHTLPQIVHGNPIIQPTNIPTMVQPMAATNPALTPPNEPPTHQPPPASLPLAATTETPRATPMAVLLSLEGFKVSPEGTKVHVNQDRSFIHEVAPNLTVFAVFDGHGDHGHDVAQFVSQSFQQQLAIDFPRPTNAQELLNMSKSITEAQILTWLRKSFTEIDRRLVESSGIDCVYSGCTASVALRFDNTIIVAYVGDSKVAGFQFNGKKPYCLVETPEHSPASKNEYRRIRQLGATVTEQYYQYFSKSISRIVEAGLSVSRSFGDIAARPYGLISEPDFVQFKIPPKTKPRPGRKSYFPLMLVVASDGLWDTISPYEILDFVSNTQQSKDRLFESLKEIAEVAWRRRLAAEGRSDDTTAIIALLQ
eukprot:Protomagalhaensia_sp_Gyna_25__2469@NODE_237_length_4229_cov_30_240811_g184_i0_p2_GENE_NODE_237_length_4229_cov_30_240811_g184_i0NODE_237_length_4229_cov_30_240811_g184_i0_p2_ORF_typecomplete_len568_score98_01PP2C/PF00481_21/3_9e42PP2C_2/PF13672_6/6e14SpoIIE/PF07228_12/30SpoIIE/PF07228_12/0_044RskA/PF10099_9/0_0065RskA/PF10099_9/1_4e03_NODE_237_length_4229_cov_30_240811_g184_i0821785